MEYVVVRTIDRLEPGTVVNGLYSDEKLRMLIAAGYVAAPSVSEDTKAEGDKNEGNSSKTPRRRVRLQHSDS